MLVEMSPGRTIDDMVNERLGNPILRGGFAAAYPPPSRSLRPRFLVSAVFTDGADRIVSEPRLDTFHPAIRVSYHSSFLSLVGHVVLVGSHPKMFQVAARRVVARVTDTLALGYRAVCQFIDHSMSFVSLSSTNERSVSIPVLCSLKGPTSVVACARVQRRMDETLETIHVPLTVVHGSNHSTVAA